MVFSKQSLEKEWFEISEVIDLLQQGNKAYVFSANQILQNATQYLLEINSSENDSGNDSECELDDDSDIPPDRRHTSPENISIYFYSEPTVDAKVLDYDDGYKRCISHIKVSGFIPLDQRCIKNLINRKISHLTTFILPSQQRIDDRKNFEEYEEDEEGYFNTHQSHLCEIYKNQRPLIDNNSIGNLFIYWTDFKKLERGVAIFAKAFMSIPAQQAAKTTRPLMPAAAPAVLVTRSLPNKG